MRKTMTGLLMGLWMGICLVGCGTTNSKLSDKFDEKTVENECIKSIEYFNDRNYQALIDMGNDEMKAAVTTEGLAEQCDPYLDKCGEFKEIEKTVVMGNQDPETKAEYGGAVMVAAYEDGKIQFTIGFDEQMKLVQFMIK